MTDYTNVKNILKRAQTEKEIKNSSCFLTNLPVDYLEAEIDQLIEEEGTSLPIFDHFQVKEGYLLVKPFNATSLAWLEATTEKGVTIPGFPEIKVIDVPATIPEKRMYKYSVRSDFKTVSNLKISLLNV